MISQILQFIDSDVGFFLFFGRNGLILFFMGYSAYYLIKSIIIRLDLLED